MFCGVDPFLFWSNMKYIIVVLFLIGCSTRPEALPQYNRGDVVSMRKFYKNCKGCVLLYSPPNQYRVVLECKTTEGGFLPDLETWVYYLDISELLEKK